MINPIYPIYIVSKDRFESMFTSRSLTRMKVPHYIVVEYHQIDEYEQALVDFKLGEYATILKAPFSNHGDGPGRARNWCWDHSIAFGFKKHWVLDDNIKGFYSLNKNKRTKVDDGYIFREAESFVDRYENVPVAGFQYRFFAVPNQKHPPFVKNTRIYSTLLIDNNCKFRWRGRYNEDTDLSLRVLKDGDCTIQFNAFLQDKAATQTVKGGNSSAFYDREGTYNKSKMLENMHPDVARVVWRYNRWHHHVDYRPFKDNQLRYKPDAVIKKGDNDDGLKLITKRA